ncbi:MAG: hypothetical protein IKE78_01460 [Erysipelotrichaceae bacterium]|nr:hypothetical protein [Erysipelotrichaceae bacterium]
MISALKLFCDVCFYLAFLTLTPFFSSAHALNAVIVLSTLVAGFLADRERRMPVRIILGLLPAVSLAFVSETAQLYFMIPLLIYLAYSVITDQMDISYDQYRYWYAIPAIVTLAMMFVIITSPSDMPLSLMFGALHLLSGVITLRIKRVGRNADPASKILNAMTVLVVVFSVTVIIGLVYGLLVHSGELLEMILLPIGFIIRQFIGIFVFMSKQIVRKPEEQIIENEPTAEDIYNEIFSNDTEQMSGETANEGGMFFVLLQRFVLIVLAVAALVLFVYLMVRVFRNFAGSKEDDVDYEKANGTETVNRKKKEKAASDRSNRQQIRNIYREFLFFVRKNGVSVNKTTTSEDILDSSPYGEDANAIRLRELYIRARYQQDSFVSNAEVSEARKCLELLTR